MTTDDTIAAAAAQGRARSSVCAERQNAASAPRSVLCRDACAAVGPLRPQLRCQVVAEILRLEHPTDLHLLAALAEGGAADPLDRFLDRLHLPQPESGNELLALGEGAIDHRAFAAAELDAHAVR